MSHPVSDEESTRATRLRGVWGSPGDGPYHVIELDVIGKRILAARYECNGCPSAHQAGRGLSQFLAGRTLEQAARIEPHDLEVLLGPLPDGHGHQYTRALGALRSALNSPFNL